MAAAGPSGDASLQAFESGSRVAVHAGLGTAGSSLVASGVNDGSPNVVLDSGGHALVAWCAFGDDAGGIDVQQVDPVTAALIGSPVTLPGSLTTSGGKRYSTCVLQTEVSRRIPLVARAGGGVFLAGATGYPTLSRVVVWRLGGGTLTAARGATTSLREPQLAADPSGRIWVGWLQSRSGRTDIVLRRSNPAATVLGAAVRIRPPRGWTTGSFEAAATADQLDVVGQFAKAGGTASIQHTTALPGLTLQRSGSGRFRVLDAGDPVRGATVRAGRRHGHTDAQGRVRLAVKRSVHARATKRGYAAASA